MRFFRKKSKVRVWSSLTVDGGGVDGGEICIDDCRPGVGGD